MNAPATFPGKSASQRAADNFDSIKRMACALPVDMQLDLIDGLAETGLFDDVSVHFWRDLKALRQAYHAAEWEFHS